MASTATELRPSSDPALADLAASIRAEHAAILDSSRQTIGRAMKAGDDLIKAKTLVGHGNWLNWLKDHCKMTSRTAERYIKLAEGREKLTSLAKGKFDKMSNMTLSAAERLISGKANEDELKFRPTKFDRFDAAWDDLDQPDQQAFIEAHYTELATLMQREDRKSKAAA